MSLADSIRNAFGSSRTFELKSPISSRERPDPIAVKTTPHYDFDRYVKVDLGQLELAYRNSPVIFNTINKIVQIIMSTPREFVGDEKSVKWFNEFFDMLGKRGGENDWEILLNKIFLYQCIYGKLPMELIYSKDGSEIVDLDLVDPKKFDYARTSATQIAMDPYGNPLGYVENLPGMVMAPKRIEPPKGVVLFQNQIFFPADRIALFKLYTVGDGFDAIGLVEPIYDTYLRHKISENGFANAAKRLSQPIPVGKVGDEMHAPTEAQLDSTLNELAAMDTKSAFAIPYYNEITLLEAKQPEKVRAYLDYFIMTEVTGMGLVLAFATSAGEATNRSTLARQEYICKLTLKDIINRTTAIINSKIISRIVDVHNENYPENKINPVKLKWGEVVLEELDSKADRMAKMAKVGLLKPTQDLDDFIRNIEKLPKERIPFDKNIYPPAPAPIIAAPFDKNPQDEPTPGEPIAKKKDTIPGKKKPIV
jgi:hypothetical protein